MLVTSESEKYIVKKRTGGKGGNLYILSQMGANVPKWAVIGSHIFSNFKKKNDLVSKFESVLHDSSDFSLKAETIEKIILNTNLDPETVTLVERAMEIIQAELYAVRSSAVDEDSSQHSFAGQLSSYLYLKSKENLIEALKKCWASAYSERSLSYRVHNHLEHIDIDVAVVIQEMINPEVSGVVFTGNPVNQKGNEIVINSVFGVGEGLVSGLIDGDTFIVDKHEQKIISSEIAEKEKKLTLDDSGEGIKEVELKNPSEKTLSDEQITEIAQLAQKIEAFYHYPQDIEWAIKDGKLYVLQARPITTNIFNESGKLFIWDNSNIIESYGGLTKPLTFSFARYVYHQVYIQFCEILLVPQKRIREMDYFLRNMLGIFYGRVFYNILNWYKLTSILPGFKYNRGFMETMMGTDHKLADEIADRIKPPAFEEKWTSKIRRFVTGLKFLYFHYTIQSVVDNFLKHFYEHYDHYKNIDYDQLDSHQIYEHYQDLERVYLRNWKAPIINDYLCMVHFGLFKMLTNKWLSKLGDSIQNDLLCGDGNLESAAPTKEIMRLASIVNDNKELRMLLTETEDSDCLEALRQSPFQNFYKEVLNYIDKFGFRCMSEMKLEQIDLSMDPTLFFIFIKNYLRTGNFDLSKMEERETTIRASAEKKVFTELSGLKKLIYKWSLKHARKAVRNRENTRFCRTRVYGIVRKMFYAIGKNFARQGIIDKDEDIFFLTLEEMTGALEGTNAALSLKKLLNIRREDYESFAAREPLSRFNTRGAVYWQNQHFEEEIIDFAEKGQLSGIGCCPGIVKGKAKVILDLDDDMNLDGEILVTKRTDPGWVPLFPSASGLLVERGGLLSHSAIVAREMGIPCVVGVKGLTQSLKTGMDIEFNGESGEINILE
ncbi:MAG: phosphoenolpyruvate synthase [Halobacteriovoraceae bacterium]|nr:phosphoenolpyruvate synthase [Halobacteriovoraceae bacterium]MCB9094019.1 phosphoenolpyruvate synthase [Halobacteriovoraceae bacterium]